MHGFTLKTCVAILSFGIAWIFTCHHSLAQNAGKKDYYNQAAGIIGYNLGAYTQKYVLKKELREISGLSYYKKDQLACVEDEHGRVYIYDLKEKSIGQVIKFGKKGDYEGIEIVGKEVFVLRSDGKIFNFSVRDMQDMEEVSATVLKTPLSSKNDVEGLGYSTKGKQLMLACKEKSKIDDRQSKGKAIYLFDIHSKQLHPDAFLDLETKKLNDFLETKPIKFKKIKEFKPSAVATHPKTQQTFVIASVGKVLVIIGKNGQLVQVIPLDAKIFKQPEGICFSPNGTMFIASEGQDGHGYILEFSYR
ncbi:SdiA-regulated domain-containing protein [Fulvivirgaceae bacterium BMA12]|uniref:SdiA-regulated domain-containing protein n=1 Tax=Agaribacillus aureus TaxID=3051825 RepID=A0ABT8L861_9BACT|nr:SdiA-regulated domain-containing protein [Fulvivirgaceae bacterium BMA12]